MQLTPIYKIPYAESTDPPDYPYYAREQALAVERQLSQWVTATAPTTPVGQYTATGVITKSTVGSLSQVSVGIKIRWTGAAMGAATGFTWGGVFIPANFRPKAGTTAEGVGYMTGSGSWTPFVWRIQSDGTLQFGGFQGPMGLTTGNEYHINAIYSA